MVMRVYLHSTDRIVLVCIFFDSDENSKLNTGAIFALLNFVGNQSIHRDLRQAGIFGAQSISLVKKFPLLLYQLTFDILMTNRR